MTVIVIYRVRSAALRRRLRSLLNAYCLPPAPGFYELDITLAQLRTILNALARFDFREGDRLYLYRMCRRCRPQSRYFGDARPGNLPDFWIA